MRELVKVLYDYWGYTSFRYPQKEIINSVLDNRDTLAILPTGAGKSICYQLPAMIKDGVCLVISPLISLIEDQIKSLRTKKIKAEKIVGSLTQNDIEVIVDNCIYGNVKFLYIAPERITSFFIKSFLQKININLIAIDEAHCISQWGHSFRPSFLNIKLLRLFFPKISLIATSASVTAKVVEDVIKQLNLVEVNLFKASLFRKNISISHLNVTSKVVYLINLLKNIDEFVIIYTRSRIYTEYIYKVLNSNGINSVFYHGGLSNNDKNNYMNLWFSSKVKVMVATNAFGMGIDKKKCQICHSYTASCNNGRLLPRNRKSRKR